MFKKTSIKAIKESLSLLIIAAIIGTIVSFVAQLFIISAKNIYEFIFNNNNFIITFDIGGVSLNLIPLIICVPSSILVGLLMYYLKLPRWFGPADTIYAAHHKAGILDLKGGFGSTLASFISISGGASVGIYGPLVHFGATVSSFIRRQTFIPKIPHDIIIGSGVAAAISAGFGAPLAGIIFAHETVLRHFSMRAVAALAIASMVANYSATEIGIVSPPLLLTAIPFEMSDILTSLALIGPLAAIVAIMFMKSMILTCSKSMIFVCEINDFTSEIDDFMRCEINDFETRLSLISMFEINALVCSISLVRSAIARRLVSMAWRSSASLPETVALAIASRRATSRS